MFSLFIIFLIWNKKEVSRSRLSARIFDVFMLWTRVIGLSHYLIFDVQFPWLELHLPCLGICSAQSSGTRLVLDPERKLPVPPTEAAFTLLLYCELLQWEDRPLREFLHYPSQTEWQRKEGLCRKIIHYFNKGKVSVIRQTFSPLAFAIMHKWHLDSTGL